MTRRDVLSALAAAPLLIAAQPKNKILKRFACNSWPFRAYFDTPQMHHYRDAQLPLLTQDTFPAFLADHFGIHNVEFLPQHFADTEPATVQKVKAALKKAKSSCCNLMGVDLAAIIDQPDLWANVATALGSPSVTVALTGKGAVDAHATAHSLKPALAVLHEQGLRMLFHNDNLKRESAEILTSIIQQLGPDRTGACPDFGNFAPQSPDFALAQLRMLAPYASNICHAKDGIAEQGSFYPDDFGASMQAMRDAAFHGLYSLEFEGLGDPIEGVRKLLNITEQFLG